MKGLVYNLIYALPNGQPPIEFKAGERQQMFVLDKTDAVLTNSTTVLPEPRDQHDKRA